MQNRAAELLQLYWQCALQARGLAAKPVLWCAQQELKSIEGWQPPAWQHRALTYQSFTLHSLSLGPKGRVGTQWLDNQHPQVTGRRRYVYLQQSKRVGSNQETRARCCSQDI